jgi:hypothetical protein
MQTTYKEQMEAIRIEMQQRIIDLCGTSPGIDKHWLALNDAYSTIAAVKWQQETEAQPQSLNRKKY